MPLFLSYTMKKTLQTSDLYSKATPDTIRLACQPDPHDDPNAGYDAPFFALEGANFVIEPLTIEAINKKRMLIGRYVQRLIRNATADCAKGCDPELTQLAHSLQESSEALEHVPPAQRLTEIAILQRDKALKLCELVYKDVRKKSSPQTLANAFNNLSAMEEKIFGTGNQQKPTAQIQH